MNMRHECSFFWPQSPCNSLEKGAKVLHGYLCNWITWTPNGRKMRLPGTKHLPKAFSPWPCLNTHTHTHTQNKKTYSEGQRPNPSDQNVFLLNFLPSVAFGSTFDSIASFFSVELPSALAFAPDSACFRPHQLHSGLPFYALSWVTWIVILSPSAVHRGWVWKSALFYNILIL